MLFNVAFLSDTGLKREHNEDSVLVNKESGTFIVADGMGGHEKGEVASRILVETFLAVPGSNFHANLGTEDDTVVPSSNIDDELNHCVSLASEKLISYTKEKGIESIIGTTIVGIKYIHNIQAWALFHLGDSRAYLFNENSLLQLTTDHSKHEVMRQKNISEEEIQKTGKNMITKAVGNFKPYKLEIQYINAKSGNIILLCSDGVSDLCNKDELLRLTIQYKHDLNLLCTQIKNLIYTRGAKDNLSIIAIEIL
jgi:protein phosphatase